MQKADQSKDQSVVCVHESCVCSRGRESNPDTPGRGLRQVGALQQEHTQLSDTVSKLQELLHDKDTQVRTHHSHDTCGSPRVYH